MWFLCFAYLSSYPLHFLSRFIEVDIDTSMERVVKRHISTGIQSHIVKQLLICKSEKNGPVLICLCSAFYRKAPRYC